MPESIHLAIPRGCIQHTHLSATVTQYRFSEVQILASAICKDLDFTEPVLGYGRGEVSVLYAPAWDRQVDAFWHGHIAVMRAVEDGFSLMRSAGGGFLTVEETAAIHSLIRR